MQLKFVDKLKNIVGKGDEAPQYFLSLAITPDYLEACIWGIVQNQTQILGYGKSRYQDIQNLQFAAGSAIDAAVEEAKVDISQVIFGLPDDWISDEKIISPYAEILKNLAKDLSLEPLAFVSITKAISHLILQEEKSPPNTILIGIFASSIVYSLIKTGKITDTKIVGRIDTNIKEMTVETIKSLAKNEILPTRMVIYGLDNLDDYLQEISTIDWDQIKIEETDKDIFLHPPKVEKLESGSLSKAVAFAGAIDLGFRPPTGVITRPQETQLDENFSFVEGQDIIEKKQQLKREETQDTPAFEEAVSLKSVGLSWTSFITDFISGKGRLVSLVAAAIILILIFLVFAYWFFPKAKVELTLRTQPLPDKKAEIIASPHFENIDEEKGQIPAQILESSQKGSQKAVTTGKKLVGEKAKGKVTVFNKTSAARNFDSGTVITASSNLKFTLDNQVSVASRSATIEGITFGKAQATVTAIEIGIESNLNSGEEFKVEDFDSSLFAARNDEAFSGGSSKEISIVSKEDQNRLEKTLIADLLEKAKSDIQAKLSPEHKLLDKAIATSTNSKSFDRKIAEESPLVTLTMEVNYKATVFSNDDLNKVLSSYVKNNLPEDFELVSQDSQTVADVSELSESGDIVFTAKLQGLLIPKLNREEIKDNVTGKNPQAVQEYLSTFSEIVESELILQPPLPGPFRRMPYRTSNIDIVVKPE